MKLNFLVTFFLGFIALNAYGFQNNPRYLSYIDSSATYMGRDYKLSKIYLDSIRNPSEKALGKRIGEYYLLRAKLDKEDYALAASLNNFFKSLQYAEKNNNYDIAGSASAEIASYFYNQQKDSIATIYYNKAVGFYKVIDDKEGLLDLMQFPAYAKYANGKPQESINLVLKDLETYKNVEGDKMYYSFAVFLLTSNYLHLNKVGKAHKYNSIYKSLKGNEYIDTDYYLNYENAINSCFVDYYFENENLDSIAYYLNKIRLEKGTSDLNLQRDLYQSYIDYSRLAGNKQLQNNYIDSLNLFNDQILENTIEASIAINDELSINNEVIIAETTAKERNLKVAFIFLGTTLFFAFLVFVYFKRIRSKKSNLRELETEFSSLQLKEEKLAVKNIEFQEFLTSIRKEVKRISTMNSLTDQKISIDNLYKEIHLNHSNFVNSEDHYHLLSSINKSFFEQIGKKCPQLDKLDVQICYYLFTGFKNKEIAIYTNRTLRAIEGKRYRIMKKLGIDRSKESLQEFLARTF